MDQWCHSNCNPDSVPELSGVNSQVCEQLFKKINSHRNCRNMNEPRFGLFFLYQYEIHNLEIEHQTIPADPREDVRWNNIKITPVVLGSETVSSPSQQEKAVEKNAEADIESVANAVKKLVLSKEFKCPECDAVFVKEGKLKQHTMSVHNQKKEHVCGHCERLLSTFQALTRHIKTHKTCTKCKMEFNSIAETEDHMKIHTTCKICNFDFKSGFNYKRHMKDIHGETSGEKSARSKLAV